MIFYRIYIEKLNIQRHSMILSIITFINQFKYYLTVIWLVISNLSKKIIFLSFFPENPPELFLKFINYYQQITTQGMIKSKTENF